MGTSRKNDPIKKCARITAKLLKAAHNSKIKKFKLDDDPLKHHIYFLYFINTLKIVLSKFKESYMMIMDYPSIRGEDFPEYSKQATWKLLN